LAERVDFIDQKYYIYKIKRSVKRTFLKLQNKMDLKALIQTVQQIAEEKGIEESRVLEAIENSLAAAYRKEYDKRGFDIRAKLSPESGSVSFTQVKEVVDDTKVRMLPIGEEEAEEIAGEDNEEKLPRYNQDRHILLEDAKKEKADAKIGDELEYSITQDVDFGRIAAQAAKQVVLQRIREAERESIVKEFKDREGGIVSGIIQRFERGNVFVDLGRTTGIMFANESIPGEHYRPGERLRFYILAVQSESKTPGIILSRAHPNFVGKLFELEIPEISDNVVEIKAIAREAGSRTKVAVHSNVEEVDPVGSCVGQRGTRIMAITNELGQEKLDVVEWSENPEEFISHSLNPAKVRVVEIVDNREARVLVAEDQLSLAIGKGGQNVRLAAKLTGWKIDVRSQIRPNEELEGGIGEVSKADGDIEEAKEEEKPVYLKQEEEEE
jgi:N utilization substance protein A